MRKRSIRVVDECAFVPLGGKLGEGKFAVVDAADAATVGRYNWRFQKSRHSRTGYAVTEIRDDRHDRESRRSLCLHRLIAGEVPLDVDHRDGDGLNNRRHNLRICTKSQNMGNQRTDRANNRSGLKGVSWAKREGKWVAQIVVDRRHHHLGYFSSAPEAAKAYDRAASRLRGEFAKLNYPGSEAQEGSPSSSAAAVTSTA